MFSYVRMCIKFINGTKRAYNACICTMQVSGMCGTSRWKAAKAVSKTMKNLDETGLIVSGCRHSIAQRAINMFRGEM